MRTRSPLLAAVAGLTVGLAPAAPPACGPGPAACGPAGMAVAGVGLATAFGGAVTLDPPPGLAVPVVPEAAALDRLGLRVEWAANVPLAGRKDSLGPVQVIDADQVFVQTRSGRLAALDARSGAQQWAFRYARPYTNLYPVGVTNRYVFAANGTVLYCLNRYTGLLEFAHDLPGDPTAGPVADDRNVYLVFGSTRVGAYRYPEALRAAARRTGDPTRGPDGRPIVGGPPAPVVSDQVAGRYGGSVFAPGQAAGGFDAPRLAPGTSLSEPGAGIDALQRTPSLTILPRIGGTPSLYREVLTPSLGIVASLQQPYVYRPEYLQSNQQTPSISTITGSQLTGLTLDGLRGGRAQPRPLWVLRTTRRIFGEPVLTDPVAPPGGTQPTPLAWLTTDGPLAYAVSRIDRGVQVTAPLSGAVAAPAAGPVAYGVGGLLGFIPQADGVLLALDLAGGAGDIPKIEWQANVGGLLNHKPVPTAAGVFASGDFGGVSRVDYETGAVAWRTEGLADRLLAVNDEHAYVFDRRGALRVYDRTRPTDPASRRADPLAVLAMDGFTRPVQNDRTDRVLVGAENGLLVCLRDAAPKYARPVVIAPPSRQPPPAPAAPAPAPAAGAGTPGGQ